MYVFAGKGKTPLRRSNNLALSVAASADQTSVQLSESSCEKSCQVTSEQIKADMKAAAENSKSNISKGITPEAGETTARPGAYSGSVWGTGSAGGTTRTEGKPVTGSVGREGPGVATSRQVGGCGCVVAGPTHTATTTDMASDSSEGTSGAPTMDSCPREAGVSQSPGPAIVNSLESTGAAGNHGSRRQGARQPASGGCASAACSSSQQDCVIDHNFVPRRPLTRSCTRLSSVSLVPESGKTDITNTETICVHQLKAEIRSD